MIRFMILIIGVIVCLAVSASSVTRVESPNGKEEISAGGQWLISWQCDSGTENVSIELSFTGGVFWDPLVPAAACVQGRGSYLWTVPNLSSPSCLVRITDLENTDDSDKSDDVFTIFPCTLRMDYDNDCVITFTDFVAFAEEWLHCGDPYNSACFGNRRPHITSSPVLSATAGQQYLYFFKAADPDGDKLTYNLIRAPAGMIINSVSGVITWQPEVDQGRLIPVIIEVRDQSGAADIQAYELDVSSLGQAIFTGAPVDGYPNLLERRMLVYTNSVRMAPQQYRDKYMASFQPDPGTILQAQSPVEPLYYHPLLNQAARFHAQDMSENGCFQHDDCDGGAWYDRILNFYPTAISIGENIAYGYSTARQVIDAWLCDETDGQCAEDGTPAAGHRTNMVGSSYKQIGTGSIGNPADTRRYFWVEDFISNELENRPPIVAGCHDFLVAGNTSFLLNYRDISNEPPLSIQVVVDGTTYDMDLDLGAQAAGTYRLDIVRTDSCREYYFLAVTPAGQLWRYPGPGVFLTLGEANCQDYR